MLGTLLASPEATFGAAGCNPVARSSVAVDVAHDGHATERKGVLARPGVTAAVSSRRPRDRPAWRMIAMWSNKQHHRGFLVQHLVDRDHLAQPLNHCLMTSAAFTDIQGQVGHADGFNVDPRAMNSCCTCLL